MSRPSSDLLVTLMLETGTDPGDMLDFVANALSQTDPLMGMDKVQPGADGRRIGMTTYRGKNYTMSMTADLQPIGGERWGFIVGVVLDPHAALSMATQANSYWEIKWGQHLDVVNQVVLQVQRDAKRLADELPVIRYNADRKIIQKPLDDIFLNLDDKLYNAT